MTVFNYEKLEVVQRGYDLIDLIYTITKSFPQSERYILTSQVQRAAISVTLNIAEGSGRYSKKDFSRFVRHSIGSLLELDACLKIAIRRKYLSLAEYETKAHPLVKELFYKLIGFEKSLIGKREV